MPFPLRSLTRCGLFVALAVVTSVFFRFTAAVVPFSLLPLVVVLAGLTLSPREAFLAMVGYVALGLVGLPVFATPPFGGPAYVLRPTFGFILGFLLGAPLVAGVVRSRVHSFLGLFGGALLGIGALYPPGLFYLWVIMKVVVGKDLSVGEVLRIGFFPFIGFDVLKAFLAALLAWRMKNSTVRERRR